MIFIALTLQNKAQTITDVDGNNYNTVTIGTQVWMKENLKTTKYNDRTSIPNIDGIPYVENRTAWANLTTPAYCWFQNNAANKDIYGALYNWHTINTGKLCPTGWHVPSDAEWATLINFLGGINVAGGKLRESGTTHWDGPNTGADNSSGFTALPGGVRDINGDCNGGYGYWWSSTTFDSNSSWFVETFYLDATCSKDKMNKKLGMSVRCLKDDATSVNTVSIIEAFHIYPNPANDKIHFYTDKGTVSYVIICDMQGKQVINMRIDSNSIDISSLPKGLYLVKIITSGNIYLDKLIKE